MVRSEHSKTKSLWCADGSGNHRWCFRPGDKIITVYGMNFTFPFPISKPGKRLGEGQVHQFHMQCTPHNRCFECQNGSYDEKLDALFSIPEPQCVCNNSDTIDFERLDRTLIGGSAQVTFTYGSGRRYYMHVGFGIDSDHLDQQELLTTQLFKAAITNVHNEALKIVDND